MDFIPEHTNIPVLELHCCFEEDDGVHLIMEHVQGMG